MKLLFTILLCSLAMARSSSPGKGTGIPDGGGGEPIEIGEARKNPGTIRGHCTLIESADTSFSSSCVDTVVILNTSDGSELSRTRTSRQGSFKFTAEKGKSYVVSADTKVYQVLAPTTTVKGGDSIELKIQPK